MKSSNHHRGASENDKETLLSNDLKSVSTRRKLLESGLKKDNLLSKSRSRGLARSTERLTSFPISLRQASLYPLFPTSTLKASVSKPSAQSTLPKCKSPASTQRKKSLDSTKISESSAKPSMRTSTERLRVIPPPSNTSRRRAEKPTDCISKISEQFSVKKVTVSYNKELNIRNSRGDDQICRALIALLSEVDYHIKESQNYPIEVFIDFLASPGIVVQAIKKIPDHILAERIAPRKLYLDNFSKSAEIFNEAGSVTNSPGFVLLVGLLEAVFTFKQIEFNSARFNKVEGMQVLANHSRERMSLDLKQCTQSVHRKNKSISDCSAIRNIPVKEGDERYAREAVEKCRQESQGIKSFEVPAIEHVDFGGEETNFMEAKDFLLGKFLAKMGISKKGIMEREKSPTKEFLNRSMEYIPEDVQRSHYIKIKKLSRPSSTTPRSRSSRKKHERNILTTTISSNKITAKYEVEKLKQKKILLGSRFYKKIDEKFIEYLADKMKKDPRDLKILKSLDFEEFSKKKNHLIIMNKSMWVNETLRHLEASDLLISLNENDLNQETKHEAMLEHLGQDKHIAMLIRKAEQMETASRKTR